MKQAAIFALALMAASAASAFRCEWDSKTSLGKHFGGTAVISGAATFVTGGNATVGFWAGMAVGVAKEAHDVRRGGTCSSYDLVFSGLGSVFGSQIMKGLIITPTHIAYYRTF